MKAEGWHLYGEMGEQLLFQEKGDIRNVCLVPNRQQPLLKTTIKPVLRGHI